MFEALLRGSIRKRLVILILFSAIPALVVLVLSATSRIEHATADSKQELLLFTSVLADTQARTTASMKLLLQTLSKVPEVRTADVEPCNKLFARLLREDPILGTINLADTRGNLIASATAKPPANFAHTKHFQDAMRDKAFATGEYLVGVTLKIPVFTFGYPILDDQGRPQAVLLASIRLDAFQRQFAQMQFPENSFVGACDHKGIRIFRQPETEKGPLGRLIHKPVFDTASHGRPGFTEDSGSDGITRIVAFAPLRLDSAKPPYMYIFTGAPKSAILANANSVLLQGSSLLILVVGLTLASGWLFGGRALGHQLEALAGASLRIGGGDHDVRVEPCRGIAEVATLTRAFNSMAESLSCDALEREHASEELLKAKLAAEAANRAKAEFLANMSHELRTPLNGVLGMLQLLDSMPSISGDSKLLLDTAMESGHSLLTIINDILSYAQLDAGKLTIAREPANLREIIDSLCRAFQYEVKAKGLSLAAAVGDSVPGHVLTDAGRVRQILLNLISNALKFTSEGQVEVAASMLPFSPFAPDRLLLVTVSDTGIGIPDDKLDIIFEPFTQVDGSLTRKYKGTGIGLGIVRQLTGLMGGNVCVVSEVAVGTTISFTIRCGALPRQPDVETAPRAGASDELRGLRVLVAEDDRVNLFTATRFLEGMGCLPVGVGNGREALEHLAKDDYDCVLMDVQMPEMDGVEATRAIRSSRELGAKARIPIIAMTAHAMSGDREQFLVAGMDGYISKPMDMDELERVLAQVVARGQGG